MKGQSIKDELLLNNCYWNLSAQKSFLGYPDLEKWAKATGKEMSNGKHTGLYADPLLSNPGNMNLTDPDLLQGKNLSDYLPAPGSPLIDAGMDIHKITGIAQTDKDISGTSVPQGSAMDIGALEYTTTKAEPDKR